MLETETLRPDLTSPGQSSTSTSSGPRRQAAVGPRPKHGIGSGLDGMRSGNGLDVGDDDLW